MVVPIQVAAFFLPLMAMIIVYPCVIRRLMRARPILESCLRGSLEELVAKERLAVGDFLVWNTHGQLQNAAVVGAVPWNRFVVITDGLLDRLDPQGVLALVRHELAHAQRRHVILRVLLVALPLWGWLWIQPVFPTEWLPWWEYLRERLPTHADPELARFLLVPLAVACTLRVALGRLSRLLEHDADLCSCGFYDSTVADETRRTAFQDLKLALNRIVPPARRDQWTWLHPSVNDRLAVVNSALCEPAASRRIAERSRNAVRWIVIGYIAAPAVAALLLCR